MKKNIYLQQFPFFYWSKLNATQNNYKMYKKLMNSQLTQTDHLAQTSPNLRFWLIKIAHRSTYQNDFGWKEALCDFYAWSMT